MAGSISRPASVAAVGNARSVQGYSRFSADDLYLFNAGEHFRLYDKRGAHLCEVGGVRGTHFAVWVSNARAGIRSRAVLHRRAAMARRRNSCG
jgi:1,4-alpha-glucan branching enzyme